MITLYFIGLVVGFGVGYVFGRINLKTGQWGGV